MIRKFIIGTAAGLFSFGAFAADFPAKNPPSNPPPPAVFNWSGFGIGAAVGYDWASSDSSIAFGKTTLTGNTSPAGLSYGGIVYAQKQYSNGLVPGVQVSYFGGSENGTSAITGLPKGVTATKKDTFSSLLLAEVKLGFANLSSYAGLSNHWLPYISGGAACGNSKTTLASGGGAITSNHGDNCGWTVGAGIDYAIYQSAIGAVILGLKYDYVDLGTVHPSFAIPGGGGVGISIPNKQKENAIFATLSVLN
jgi:outer membrane immunogenic protein